MNTRTLLGALVFITAPVCLQATTSSVPLNYEYDANGNLISGDGKYYGYNDANRLVKIRHYDKTGPVISEYVYDHTGQRVKKIEDGVTTYYIGKHFEAQPDGDKLNNTSYYFANGERVAKKDSAGQFSYYHTNHLGSTSVMTDKDGKLVENTRYYPFGEIREGGKEKYSFTGKEKDRTSESYYFEARHYGSEFKHFTQADTVEPDYYDPQDCNKYSYVINNPVINIDKDGHSATGFATELAKGGLSFAGIFVNASIASISIVRGNYLEGASNVIDAVDSFNESSKHFTAAILNAVRENDINSQDIPDAGPFSTKVYKNIRGLNDVYSTIGLFNIKSYRSLKYLKSYKYFGKDIHKTILFLENTKQYYSLIEKYIESERYVRNSRKK